MSIEPTHGLESPHPAASASVIARTGAILEVVLAFAFVHVSYRSFKHFTEIGQREGTSGLNFSTGATMLLFTLAVLLATRRNFREYGLTLKGWRFNLNVALLWTLLTALAVAVIVHFRLVHFDPLHPPDLTRALVFSAGEMVLILLLLVFLRRERPLLRRLPAFASLLLVFVLASLPVVFAIVLHRDVFGVLLSVLWLFFGAGFGEEIFFRGYIQSRVNQAFGRPWHLLGMQFGVGLIVSSVLFGFIHALNTVDYFGGRFAIAWLWMLTNCFSGLFYGCLRERTGSIMPGAVMHGLEDVLAIIPGLVRG
jgi:membrane protease YdiL (CAAX protease family)